MRKGEARVLRGKRGISKFKKGFAIIDEIGAGIEGNKVKGG